MKKGQLENVMQFQFKFEFSYLNVAVLQRRTQIRCANSYRLHQVISQEINNKKYRISKWREEDEDDVNEITDANEYVDRDLSHLV